MAFHNSKGNETTKIKVTYGDYTTVQIIKTGKYRLIVEGFVDFVPESGIYEVFSKFGDSLYCPTPVDANKNPACICVVTCRIKQDADNIILHMNNAVDGKKITVIFNCFFILLILLSYKVKF